jgi:hypothetical protein
MKISVYMKFLMILLGISLITTSCFNDLDTVPLDPDSITAANVYDDPGAYRQVLAKLYAGLAVSGQQGPAGQGDISGIDEGFGQYVRGLWYHQELPTDEAVIGWNDQTIKDFHEQDWTSFDPFINAFYSRIFYQISLCNEFLRETTEGKLNGRGVDGALRQEIELFRVEARFLRALSYWHALDHFRNVPFVTEEDQVGAFFPEQIQGPQLYDWLIGELNAIEGQMAEPRSNEYGRADRAAAWALLAKLYLNAEVYAGKPAYTECIDVCNRIINAGYSLEPVHSNLFGADNNLNDEFIFAVPFDGTNTRTWGGTTFIVRAGIGGTMDALSDFGVAGGWGGTRVTSALVNKFPTVGGGAGEVIVAPNAGNTYDQIYVPGAYQGWDPETARALASPNADNIFEGTVYFADANNEFKFTPNPDWSVDYGDDEGDGVLEQTGGNIVVADPGFYYFQVDLNTLEYSIEPFNIGLIGSATPGGWDDDTDMTYDPEEDAWTIEIVLAAGEIKFRANDDWAFNLGDDGADALLEKDGSNIQIADAGQYLIKLFLDKPDYTFSVETTASDSRGTFWTDGQSLEIADISQFTEGYASTKWSNVTRDGQRGSNLEHTDTDFPMFRLADIYLMYAEAVLRGGSGGSTAEAVQYVNLVLERAYSGAGGNITESDLTLDFLLDERARELFWEAHRRTDLVRFGQFTNGDYLWPWKGGEPDGVVVSETYDIFPIPAQDITINPNLTQNPGY